MTIYFFWNTSQEKKDTRRDPKTFQGASVQTAVSLRLRPILMTTGAMFLGSLPLVLSQDYGCESKQAIGIVLTSGLFFGTILVLTIFPVLCVWMLKHKKVVF